MLLDLAKTALTQQIAAIPCRMDGTKRPAIPWKPYQTRLPTIEELVEWFPTSQEGIGIITGQISGGLEMIEFEGRAIIAGIYQQYLDLLDQHHLLELWETITDGYSETTPTGGIHILYRCDQIEGNKKLATDPTSGLVLAETRGEGGYVVIAPTSGRCHPTGHPWTINHGGLPTIQTITPTQRQQLHHLATQLTPQPAPATPPQPPSDDDRPGDWYNQTTTQQQTLQLLTSHGWTPQHTDPDGTIHLTRPGKTTGTSATLGHPNTGQNFYVFTSSTPFQPEHSYTPFQIYATLEHAGNYHLAAQTLNQQRTNNEPTWTITTTPPPQPPVDDIQFLDLDEIATGIYTDEQWLIEPILPTGRQTSLYAQGKTGKSLLALEIALATATGRPILHRPQTHPTHVIYVDYEMTPSDLQERLDDLGYTPNDPDWNTLKQHLHYAQLQPFHPFDTLEGGQQIHTLAQTTQAQLVIIDTLIRSVRGEENSSDTIKDFNRFTGLPLKAAGITLLRIDHAGKDADKGQRGSSAKRDDVDLIWQLKTETKNGDTETLTLTNRASRMAWVPHTLTLTRTTNPLHHTIPATQLTSTQSQAWQYLEDIGHPPNMGLRATWTKVREEATKLGHVRQAIYAAQTYRKK